MSDEDRADDTLLGDELRRRRRTAGYSHQTLSEACGTSKWTIKEAENKRQPPSDPDVAAALADVLSDVTPIDITPDQITEIREQYELSQSDLSEIAGVKHDSAGRWERGRTALPEHYGNLIAGLRENDMIDAEGNTLPNTDDLDPRAHVIDTSTPVPTGLLRETIESVQQLLEMKPFVSTFTTSQLFKTVMGEVESVDGELIYGKQRVGAALAHLSKPENRRPEQDGFMIVSHTDRGSAPDRYAVKRAENIDASTAGSDGGAAKEVGD